jgi:hypothetical protein
MGTTLCYLVILLWQANPTTATVESPIFLLLTGLVAMVALAIGSELNSGLARIPRSVTVEPDRVMATFARRRLHRSQPTVRAVRFADVSHLSAKEWKAHGFGKGKYLRFRPARLEAVVRVSEEGRTESITWYLTDDNLRMIRQNLNAWYWASRAVGDEGRPLRTSSGERSKEFSARAVGVAGAAAA